jgi:hypothetical protein
MKDAVTEETTSALKDLPARPASTKDFASNPPTGGEPGHAVVISIIGVLIG